MTTAALPRAFAAPERGLEHAQAVLRFGLGAAAFLAGLDKFFNRLTDWGMYLSPWMTAHLPLAPDTFMRLIGVVEMAAGVLVLSRWTRVGAYVVALWLTAISIQLAASGTFFDLAVRDVEMALAAFALAKLTEWRSARTPAAG